MTLNNQKEEFFELKYTIGMVTKLKKTLKCENLRRHLLMAANKEDYETLAKAIQIFSGGKLHNEDETFPAIDQYMQENGVSSFEMFIQLIHEVDEAGFFKDKKTLEELEEMANSPGLGIDMETLYEEAMKNYKGKLMDKMVAEILPDTMTGANTSTTSGLVPTDAE